MQYHVFINKTHGTEEDFELEAKCDSRSEAEVFIAKRLTELWSGVWAYVHSQYTTPLDDQDYVLAYWLKKPDDKDEKARDLETIKMLRKQLADLLVMYPDA